jgi:hypothetical protein
MNLISKNQNIIENQKNACMGICDDDIPAVAWITAGLKKALKHSLMANSNLFYILGAGHFFVFPSIVTKFALTP